MICARIETITCTYKGAHLLASHTFLHVPCVFNIFLYIYIYLFVYLCIYLCMIVTCTKWKGGKQTYLGPLQKNAFLVKVLGLQCLTSIEALRYGLRGVAQQQPWMCCDLGWKRTIKESRGLFSFSLKFLGARQKKQPSIGLLPCAGAASVRKVLHEYVVPWLKPFWNTIYLFSFNAEL